MPARNQGCKDATPFVVCENKDGAMLDLSHERVYWSTKFETELYQAQLIRHVNIRRSEPRLFLTFYFVVCD